MESKVETESVQQCILGCQIYCKAAYYKFIFIGFVGGFFKLWGWGCKSNVDLIQFYLCSKWIQKRDIYSNNSCN